jgi:hypothetical protein
MMTQTDKNITPTITESEALEIISLLEWWNDPAYSTTVNRLWAAIAESDSPEFTPFACWVGHEALYRGELRNPAEGYEYIGKDARGLPTAYRDIESGEIYPIGEGVSNA